MRTVELADRRVAAIGQGTWYMGEDPARNAAPEGTELEIVPVVVKAGGGAFHHGLTWHGSAPNTRHRVAAMVQMTSSPA